MSIFSIPEFAGCVDCGTLDDEVIPTRCQNSVCRTCSKFILLPPGNEGITSCAYRVRSKKDPFDIDRIYLFIPIEEKIKHAAGRGIPTVPGPKDPDDIDLPPYPLQYERTSEICGRGGEDNLSGRLPYSCSLKHYVVRAVDKGPKASAGPLVPEPRFEKVCIERNGFRFCYGKPIYYSINTKIVNNASKLSISITPSSQSSKPPFSIANGKNILSRKPPTNSLSINILNYQFPNISIVDSTIIKWQIPKINKELK